MIRVVGYVVSLPPAILCKSSLLKHFPPRLEIGIEKSRFWKVTFLLRIKHSTATAAVTSASHPLRSTRGRINLAWLNSRPRTKLSEGASAPKG